MKNKILISILLFTTIFFKLIVKASEFESPYSRTKNGPPLTNIIHKVNKLWLYDWLKDPKHYNPDAKMPNLKLNNEEIIAVMSYLNSIADEKFPKVAWKDFLFKKDEEMTEQEFEEMDKLYSKGKAVWGQSRCSICHTIKGPEKKLVGGYVNLHVGIDLSKINTKINRNWLFHWIKDPKNYFPDTIMPRYRFSDEEIRSIVEYIMRDAVFTQEKSQDETQKEIVFSKDSAMIKNGKTILELSRCVVCHDIKGIKELLPVNKNSKQVQIHGFDKLLYDVKCMTCHNIKGKGGTYAPELTYAGSKLKEKWIESFLQTPDIIRPLLQQMPKFNLTESEAKIAKEYIKKNFLTGEVKTIPKFSIDNSKIENGEELFYKKGCQSCHQIGPKGGVLGPNLSEIGDRLESEFIFLHLKNPHRFKPDAVEPNYGFSDEEAKKLTYFLMGLRKKE